MAAIVVLDVDAVHREQPALIALLRDVVDDGGSVGFLPPLAADDAREYWESVAAALKEGGRRLWVAREDGAIVGTVQLDLERRANGRHRAELIKLMVHPRARRRGVARALMLAAQDEARRLGRRTLVLDTRQGDPSEALYRSLGWSFAGAIPQYARSGNGELHATALYYLLLED
ncbi:MAG TPA: GNAT family N-acetyltransferase [Methylomirabilota bacterium]|jgi:ribosomal protein S18 acetylase RimI-like enzyme